MMGRIPGLGRYRPHIYKQNGIWHILYNHFIYVNFTDNTLPGVWQCFKEKV